MYFSKARDGIPKALHIMYKSKLEKLQTKELDAALDIRHTDGGSDLSICLEPRNKSNIPRLESHVSEGSIEIRQRMSTVDR